MLKYRWKTHNRGEHVDQCCIHVTGVSVPYGSAVVMDWEPHDVSEAFYRMWMVCALVCRELEFTVWVMWRPCEVDVRCLPDVRGLNAALCGAFYSEQRCGCAVPGLEWSVIRGGFLCFRVKKSVLVRCLFGFDVWNFQGVRLINAVVF